ncbi:hypothetical protein F5890DRAFT_109814 [Lentinula detonsa]|uniref:Uncharacterized protein n=1 Tax=Lentinula detonsa TaxID=2804962 RepID=A0AA38PXV2_9AGAR|nr:hypothetical protein F5890DRAFT_109814 [Lentinula detonsa]
MFHTSLEVRIPRLKSSPSPLYLLILLTMCYREIRGDLYRGCQPIQHFQRTDYAPGPIIDCNSPYCGVSNAHMHTSPCNCSQRIAIRERIVNQFYTICDNCKRIELDRRVGRR